MSVARVISAVLEPMVVLLVSAVYAGFTAGLSGAAAWGYMLYLFVFAAAISYVRTVIARKHGTNWDLSEHRKRIGPLGALVVIFAVNMVAVSAFGSPSLSRFHMFWFLWAAGFYLITLTRKISGHMSVYVFSVGQSFLLFGPTVPGIIALGVVPMLAWSRVRLGRHTWAEVIMGTAYAIFVLIISVRFPVW